MKFVITGGAGFIGCNAAWRCMQDGHEVVIFDSLSRQGGEQNLSWLAEKGAYAFIRGDIRDEGAVRSLVGQHPNVDVVLHLAAQVAVTTSVQDPRLDFEVNALGTFNVLEIIRQMGLDPVLIFGSTNKVYGPMDGIAVANEQRYEYSDGRNGISEYQPIDLHSPYGCSKGAADQYVRDFARIYGLRTVVFRQSCIYGPRQFGIEDQGWVAWFIIAGLLTKPITIYGDGRQVRDLLFIDDLLDAYWAAITRIEVAQGQIYNIGGGRQNALSVWLEFGSILSEIVGHEVPVTFAPWRPGDQRIYISDISKAKSELGWEPRTGIREGLSKLYEWIIDNRRLVTELTFKVRAESAWKQK